MSKLPTLLVKGNLKSIKNDPEEQKRLDKYIPIDYIYEWIKSRESLQGVENRVLILKAQVASGKSTALIAGLYITFLHGNRGPGIICSQPRVLTAIKNVQSIAREPSYESYLRMGKTIGWSTGSNKLLVPSYGVLSCTIGTLSMILKTNTDSEIIRRYKFIIIDEFHERDLETDMTTSLLKHFVYRNKGNKSCPFIILMSATFDQNVPLRFFGVESDTNFIFVEGRSYGTEEIWKFTEPVNNLTRAAADVVKDIAYNSPDDEPEKSDILIFMPGTSEIKMVVRDLETLNAELFNTNKPIFSISILDSATVNGDKLDARKILMPLADHTVFIKGKKVDKKPLRRVVVGTNVAETGLTIDSLKYLIDSGIHRGTEYYPAFNINILITKPASKSRIIQRRGRVGRKQKGIFYPLYPKYIFDKLEDQQLPNILLDDISPIILSIVQTQITENGYFDVKNIDMIDIPAVDALTHALKKLTTIGFLLIKDGKYVFSEIGTLAAKFMKCTPEMLRMIFAGYSWKCSIFDLISIAVFTTFTLKDFMLDSAKPFAWEELYKMALPNMFKADDENVVYKNRLLVADDFINGAIFAAAFKQRIMQDENMVKKISEWCARININFDKVVLYIQARNELIEQFISLGLNIIELETFALSKATLESFESIITQLKRCIYEGYRCNILELDDATQTYYTRDTHIKVITPPMLSKNEETYLISKKMHIELFVKPKHVIYNKLTMRYKQKLGEFITSTDFIAVMDGYVALDPLAQIKP